MKRLFIVLIVPVLFCLALGPTEARAGRFEDKAPDLFYEVPSPTLESVVLGRTCMSLTASRNSLSCNPAMLAADDRTQLRFNAYLDNHFKQGLDYRNDVRDDNAVKAVDRLLGEQRAIGARLGGSAWYQHEWWAIAYTPARIAYVSNVRNPAYPEVAMTGFYESEVLLKAGLLSTENENLKFGLQLRYLDRDFVYENTALLSALADPDLIQVQTMQALNIEPAAVYTFSEDLWRTSISLMIADTQLVLNGPNEFGTKPTPELGLSSQPAFANGRLMATSHLSLRRGEELSNCFRWGLIFDAHIGAFALNLARRDQGVGFSTAIDSLTLGVAYKRELFISSAYESKLIKTVLGEVGLRF